MALLATVGVVAVLVVVRWLPTGVHRVSGTVRYSDGSPVPEGRVVVEYGTHQGAWGAIQKDGAFTIGRFTENDGMEAGKVRVAVKAWRESGNPNLPAVPIVDPRFGDVSRSGLEFEVPKQCRWDIVVEKPSGP